MPKKIFVLLDYETFSVCDLTKAGAWEYSKHPSTEVLCAGWTFGTLATLGSQPVLLATPGDKDMRTLKRFLQDPDVTLVAHNAFFEQCITRNVLGIETPENRWICTAALAAAMGLPRKLEDVCLVLGLHHTKDKLGHRIMLKLSKPRKPTKSDPRTRWEDPEDYASLYDYCVKDVRAETELFLKLPPLLPDERDFWLLDQRMNHRGFAVDRKLALGALKLIAEETRLLDSRASSLTQGAINSTRQRDATLAWLFDNGCTIENLKAETITKVLKSGKTEGIAKELLEIRDAVRRSSTTKYKAFELRSRSDGRVRDNTKWYGAHTGRQSATGLQMQNLFKRVMSQAKVEAGLKLIRNVDLTRIRKEYDSPMDLYASAIRSCVVAGPGKILDQGDFSMIEVCVLFWIANHTEGVNAINEGRDLYIDMASRIYNEKPEVLLERVKVEDDTALGKRTLGKITVLGAGFGIGVGGEKFQATVKNFGVDIPLPLARIAIEAYRNLHWPVPKFWKVIEKASIQAMLNPGLKVKHGRLSWVYKDPWLSVQLPSGRFIHYFQPKLEKDSYGLKLSYMGTNPVTRKYERTSTWGGKLTENVVQGIARDVLRDALLRIEKSGVTEPVMAVHDEIVAERKYIPGDEVSHEEFLDLMREVPPWARGLPIQVKGWTGKRYKK